MLEFNASFDAYRSASPTGDCRFYDDPRKPANVIDNTFTAAPVLANARAHVDACARGSVRVCAAARPHAPSQQVVAADAATCVKAERPAALPRLQISLFTLTPFEA
jgi:hypothetical protein